MKTKIITFFITSSLLFSLSGLIISNISYTFVGPRNNVASSTPTDYGFWSFAIPVKNILARSGQPTAEEFKWLKEQGYKGVINFRLEGEYGEVTDDAKLPGFNELGFNYLRLQINDGGTPTDEQVNDFLNFVKNKKNQPVLIHCRGGIGRTGLATALYRYEVQNWPMSEAINESLLFKNGINNTQEKWLINWAKNHPKKINYLLLRCFSPQ